MNPAQLLELVKPLVNRRRDQLVENLKKLVEIPTENPPGCAYGELVTYVREYLVNHGVRVEVLRIPDEYASRFPGYDPRYPRYVLLASVGSGLEVIHFNGHYDVVPAGTGWSTDPFKPKVVDSKLYGRGASDMKGGVASIVEALAILAELDGKLEHKVTLSLVPDEETTSMGMKYVVDHGLVKAEYAVVAEPTGLRHIDIGCKGGVWLVVCVEGVQAHASRPWLGVNAFEKAVFIASEILGELKPRIASRASAYPFPDENSKRATIELGGYVRGGSKSNTLPAEFCFSIDRRVLPEESSSEALNEITGFIEKAARKHGVSYKLFIEDLEDPYVARGAEHFVELLASIARQVTGYSPAIYVKTGFTEMALLGRTGVKAITYGPGSEEVAHAANEYVDIDEVVKAVEVFASLALAVHDRVERLR